MENDVYAHHAQVCGVFSNPTRIRLLDLLGSGEKSVKRLMDLSGLSQANVSQHLGIMKLKGIVLSRRSGRMVYYRVSDPRIIQAFKIIRAVISERIR